MIVGERTRLKFIVTFTKYRPMTVIDLTNSRHDKHEKNCWTSALHGLDFVPLKEIVVVLVKFILIFILILVKLDTLYCSYKLAKTGVDILVSRSFDLCPVTTE